VKTRHLPASRAAALALLTLATTMAYADPDAAPPTDMLDRPVPEEQLESLRGGAESAVFNFMHLQARLDNNVAILNSTGSNAVTDGAFTNASGLATVIQNSGNNVLIQNATILNLQLK
jgi:hypothetical protein